MNDIKENKDLKQSTMTDILDLIYYFGRGVMYLEHIYSYKLKYDNEIRETVNIQLNELEEDNYIEYIEDGYIKIKKAGIAFLIEKDSEEIKSIYVTKKLIRKSYIKNAFLLDIFFKGYCIKTLVNLFLTQSTFCSNQFNCKKILERSNKESKKEEYKRLKDYEEGLFQKSIRNNDKESFDLRNMIKRGIYIFYNNGKVYVYLMDVKGKRNIKEAIKNINETNNYLSNYFEASSIKYRWIIDRKVNGEIYTDEKISRIKLSASYRYGMKVECLIKTIS